MNNIQKSKYNVLISLLYQVVAIALGLIIPKITMVGYGSGANGLLSSALQFVGYLTLFEAGIQAVARKSLYKTVGSNDRAGTNAILSAVNKNYKKVGIYYFIGLIILSAVYPLFAKGSGYGYLTVFFVVFFSGLSNVVLFFFQGKYQILLQVEGKQYFIGILNIITNVSNHGIKILLLALKANIVFVVLGSFVASMIPAVIIMAYIKKGYTWIDLKAKPDFSALSQSKDAIVHQVSWLVISSADTFLLTLFCDLKIVSVYAIYKMIYTYIYTFSKIPFDSIVFRLGQLYSNDKERFKQYINSVELFSSSIAFSLFTVTLCLTTAFVKLYTSGVQDADYVDSKIAVLFTLVQLLSFMREPMLRTIYFAGHFKQTIKPTIIEVIINLLGSAIGVQFFGIYGVLLGQGCAFLYRTIDIIVYSNKKLLSRSPLRNFTYYIIQSILVAGIYIIYINLNIVIDSYFKFIFVGGILTVAVFVTFISILCLLFRKEFLFLKTNLLKRGEIFSKFKKIFHKKNFNS